METISQLASGLADKPTAWMLAIALVAVVYLFRELSKTKSEQLDMIMRQESAHRDTLMKIVPISEKLTDSVEVLERVTTSLLARGEKE